MPVITDAPFKSSIDGPLPLFGAQGTRVAWNRPSGGTFSTHFNFSPTALSTAVMTDNAPGPISMVAINDLNGSDVATVALKTFALSPSWTIIAGVHWWMDQPNSASFGPNILPLILYDTGADTGEFAYLGIGYGGGSGKVFFEVNKGTSFSADAPGGFTFTELSKPILVHTTGGADPALVPEWVWWKVTNDNVNLTWYYSRDGYNWQQVYQEALGTTLTTIDKVGFGMDRFNSAGVGVSNNYINLWHWTEG